MAITHLVITVEVQVRSSGSPCGIWIVQSGTQIFVRIHQSSRAIMFSPVFRNLVRPSTFDAMLFQYQTVLVIIFFTMAPQPQWARVFLLSRIHGHTQTQHTRQDYSERVISPTQGPLLHSTQHSQERDINTPGGIRTHNSSNRAAADPRLRQ